MRKSFRIPICILLLTGLFISSCAPSTRNIKTREYPKYGSSIDVGISLENSAAPATDRCQVHTVALIGSWVSAGLPEKDAFEFSDIRGKPCQGSFESDVLPLFTTPNLWYAGALSCRTCHGPDVAVSYGGLNLSSYQGIMAGAKGQDILGGGSWQSAKLSGVLSSGMMPPAKPSDYDVNGPVVTAGALK